MADITCELCGVLLGRAELFTGKGVRCAACNGRSGPSSYSMTILRCPGRDRDFYRHCYPAHFPKCPFCSLPSDKSEPITFALKYPPTPVAPMTHEEIDAVIRARRESSDTYDLYVLSRMQDLAERFVEILMLPHQCEAPDESARIIEERFYEYLAAYDEYPKEWKVARVIQSRFLNYHDRKIWSKDTFFEIVAISLARISATNRPTLPEPHESMRDFYLSVTERVCEQLFNYRRRAFQLREDANERELLRRQGLSAEAVAEHLAAMKQAAQDKPPATPDVFNEGPK